MFTSQRAATTALDEKVTGSAGLWNVFAQA
jgi:hypothetical protein